jgi:hypothetical protein
VPVAYNSWRASATLFFSAHSVIAFFLWSCATNAIRLRAGRLRVIAAIFFVSMIWLQRWWQIAVPQKWLMSAETRAAEKNKTHLLQQASVVTLRHLIIKKVPVKRS